MTGPLLSLVAAALAQPVAAEGRPRDEGRDSPAAEYLSSVPADEQPDVVLDVPRLVAEEAVIEIEELDAKVSLDARLGDVLSFSVGADAQASGVNIVLKGVDAKAALIVRLDAVRSTIVRTLESLDDNPALAEALGSTREAAGAEPRPGDGSPEAARAATGSSDSRSPPPAPRDR